MLTQKYPEDLLRRVLLPPGSGQPFPAGTDREVWTSLPDFVRQLCIQRGEDHLGTDWPPVQATTLLDFVRTGHRNRSGLANPSRNTLRDLLLAEAVEWKGRFIDDILNGVWSICDEASWTIPAALYIQKTGFGLPDTDDPIIDLSTGKTVMVLAAADLLVGPQLDALSPHIRPRIRRKVERRVFHQLHTRNDFWWMGFGERIPNNWNPWICSNLLAGILLLETDPDARVAGVARIMQLTDNFLDRHEPDGGCNEGPSYWDRSAGSLSELLVFLREATGGAIDVFDEPLIQNLGRFLYGVHIHDRYFANFADTPPVWTPPPAVLFQFGTHIGDDRLKDLGKFVWDRQSPDRRFSGKGMSRDFLTLALWEEMDAAPKASPPCVRDVWLPDTQVCVARDEEGSSDGFFVAAKGGHNAESHNHNDVGSVIVYRDGRPILIDVGVGTYTKQTFSEDRYEIWTMQSGYHNLPTINGATQENGASFAAKSLSHRADDERAEFSLDVSDAYPKEAGVGSWVRTVTLERKHAVVISDHFTLDTESNDLLLSFVTPCRVETGEDGRLDLGEWTFVQDRPSGSAILEYDPVRLSAALDPIALDDENLVKVWGTQLTRILLSPLQPVTEDTWTIRIT